MADSSSKRSLLSSPTLAGSFTLFSLLCTAVLVLYDRRYSNWVSDNPLRVSNEASVAGLSNSSVSLLDKKDGHTDKKDGIWGENDSQENRTENSERKKDGDLGKRESLSDPMNQTVKSESKKDGDLGKRESLSDPMNKTVKSESKKDGDLGKNESLLDPMNQTVKSGSKKDGHIGKSGSLSNPMNQTVNSESKKGGYFGKSGSLLNPVNQTVKSESAKVKKDGYLGDSDSLSNPMNKTVNSSVLSNTSVNLLNNETVKSESEKDKMVNVNVNGKAMGDQLRVSNSSIPRHKDGHLGESDSLSNPMNQSVNSSILSNPSVNLLHNDTVKSNEKDKRVNVTMSGEVLGDRGKEDLWEKMIGCDIFDGNWVKDDSYPLYKPGSCPYIDEPFDCYQNGRPDNGYEKFRWQPKGCNIPRLNGRDMLEMLRGKRLVYVGDSLNRNMWESMVCTLRNAVEDKRKVFEASGKKKFRTEHSYSFVFEDYNCSVEFFRSTFLVREWEMPDANGLKKETLRLDMVSGLSDRYKNADILVFNTGHWWTHEKTSLGKGYYQEGSHVYDELNVMEAFRRAMTTWGRWIDANINPTKTLVFFRGYSVSHFRGGQWNSGGQCDSETVPIKNETYLAGYPPKMSMLERVMSGMKTPVLYLNVSKMTDFRKDAHPSIFRSQQQHLTEEERKSPLRFQDCSHWCLPGVPETWNELLYAQIFTKYKQQKEKLQRSRQ